MGHQRPPHPEMTVKLARITEGSGGLMAIILEVYKVEDWGTNMQETTGTSLLVPSTVADIHRNLIGRGCKNSSSNWPNIVYNCNSSGTAGIASQPGQGGLYVSGGYTGSNNTHPVRHEESVGNLQHISEREPDDWEEDPSLHPTTETLFMEKSKQSIQSE